MVSTQMLSLQPALPLPRFASASLQLLGCRDIWDVGTSLLKGLTTPRFHLNFLEHLKISSASTSKIPQFLESAERGSWDNQVTITILHLEGRMQSFLVVINLLNFWLSSETHHCIFGAFFGVCQSLSEKEDGLSAGWLTSNTYRVLFLQIWII